MFVVTLVVPSVSEMVVPLLPPLEELRFSSFVSRMMNKFESGEIKTCNYVELAVLIDDFWQSWRNDVLLTHW